MVLRVIFSLRIVSLVQTRHLCIHRQHKLKKKEWKKLAWIQEKLISRKKMQLRFFQKGCACKGQHPCYLQFPKEHYRKMRNDCFALDQDPKCLDLLITGQIMANCNREMDSEEEKGSKNTRTGFYHLSKKVKQLQYYAYFYSDFIHLTDLQSNFPIPTRNRGNSVQESEGQLH